MSSPAKSEKLSRNTTASEVTRAIRRKILLGEYPPGEFLRQEAIADELGVSRLPVREAMAQLEIEGFVIREKYRGALVAHLSVAEIKEIYDLRAMIEPHLLKAAAPHLTPALIKKLYGLIEKSRACRDVERWAELNRDFHRMLYEPSQLTLTLQVLENLMARAERYFKLQRFMSLESRNESDAEHSHVLDLCGAGKIDEAAETLHRHITWNANDVMNSVTKAIET